MIGILASVKSAVTTLLSRVPSNNATLVANLDAAVSTRAASATALSTAIWTSTRAGYLDKIGIRSIQTGYVTLTLSSTNNGSGTATLSTTLTDTSKAFMLLTGLEWVSSSGINLQDCRPSITNTTTVTVTWRNQDTGALSSTMRVHFLVVEFMG